MDLEEYERSKFQRIENIITTALTDFFDNTNPEAIYIRKVPMKKIIEESLLNWSDKAESFTLNLLEARQLYPIRSVVLNLRPELARYVSDCVRGIVEKFRELGWWPLINRNMFRKLMYRMMDLLNVHLEYNQLRLPMNRDEEEALDLMQKHAFVRMFTALDNY